MNTILEKRIILEDSIKLQIIQLSELMESEADQASEANCPQVSEIFAESQTEYLALFTSVQADFMNISNARIDQLKNQN